MRMNRDFIELLQSFSEAGVRFLVVGAHALAVHARPRVTGGLDLWVDPTQENAQRVYRALAAFGAPLDRFSVEDFARPDTVVQFGVPPVRIDVLTAIDGIASFSVAYDRGVEATFEGLSVRVLGRDDFLMNKRAAGRPKDLRDIEMVERLDRLRGRPGSPTP